MEAKPLTAGQKLKRLRREKDLSQTELAKKLGTTLVTISSYENDKTRPSSDMLIKIGKLFNVSMDYLISGSTSGSVQIKNKELLKRVEQLDRINPDELKGLIDVMDVYIQNKAAKQALVA